MNYEIKNAIIDNADISGVMARVHMRNVLQSKIIAIIPDKDYYVSCSEHFKEIDRMLAEYFKICENYGKKWVQEHRLLYPDVF